jgi:hypothetical protein
MKQALTLFRLHAQHRQEYLIYLSVSAACKIASPRDRSGGRGQRRGAWTDVGRDWNGVARDWSFPESYG